MSSHFRRLLEGTVEQPGQRISDLPLLSDAERRTLLGKWSRAEAGSPGDGEVSPATAGPLPQGAEDFEEGIL